MTQREQIINEIKQKGFLNSYYATYTLGIKQAPTRVHELKKLGYNIQSRPSLKHDDSVDWYLGSEVRPNAPEPTQSEWVFVGNMAYLKQEPVQESLI